MSPAKIMDFSPSAVKWECSKPKFESQANELMSLLEHLTVEDIMPLMNINVKQAIDVYQYFQSFRMAQAPRKQAALTYNGIAYQGLDFESFDATDVEYAQSHYFVFSALYGMLRPLDEIKPYRLEMQLKLANSKGATLYDYWKETLTNCLIKELKANDNIWLNLMSKEYTKVIDKKQLPKGVRIITPDFKEQTATGYRQVVVHTKKARGLMARFVIKNRVSEIEHLRAFDAEGYTFSDVLSKGDNWVFVR